MSKRVAVLMSGGLDSTVVASMACRMIDNDGVHLLFFDYGQKMSDKEIDACLKIYGELHDQYPHKDLVFKNFGVELLEDIGGSALTDYRMEVQDGAEFLGKPTAWVPARNLVLLSLATAYADKNFLSELYVGFNKQESVNYTDAGEPFFNLFDEILKFGAKNEIRLIAPLLQKNKRQIVELGLTLDAPIKESWSCYKDGEKHCGVCSSCLGRKKAFADCDIPIDPDEWENTELRELW